MEESGSIGLEQIVREESQRFFKKHVDCICISDNAKLLTRMYKQALILNDPTAWLGTKNPCITYGLRRCSDFYIEVSGAGADLHYGGFGKTLHIVLYIR